MAKGKSVAMKWVKVDDRLFTLEVCIIDGPMTEKFIKNNKSICRTIEIRADQTLEDLHRIIFTAFDRKDNHMYEFQVGGSGPMDPKARRYVLPIVLEDVVGDEKPAGTVNATIGSLGLKKDDAFGYLFDFGDDWWHQINVMGIKEKAAPGKYPKIIGRIGNSPPQYADLEEPE